MAGTALSAAGAAAAGQAKSANGALGLVFVLLLGIAVAFLLRSMNKHLRKAQRMKLEEERDSNDADGVANVDLRKQT
jgi:Na+/glutamate symporter